MDYGKILKEHRENAGLSQQQLAKATNLSQQGISCWEQNLRTPNITACIQLADFYGISVDELIGHTVKNNW